VFQITKYLNPADPFVATYPLATLQDYYSFKHRIAQLLQPQTILEVGVRFGYSAAAFLSACPTAAYVGIDGETNSDGGVTDSNQWALDMLRRHFPAAQVAILKIDTQKQRIPVGAVDFAHVDGRHTEEGCLWDLHNVHATWILVDDVDYIPEVGRAVKRFVVGKQHVFFPGFRGECLIKTTNKDATEPGL
jgi:hypothetical protein